MVSMEDNYESHDPSGSASHVLGVQPRVRRGGGTSSCSFLNADASVHLV